jgi:nucleoside-triphosphatase
MTTEPTQILLTGRPGVGKTTAARRTAELLAGRGVPVAGFLTEELRHRGRRIGFRGIPLAGGSDRVIANVGLPPPRVGRYGVAIEAIDRLADDCLELSGNVVFVVDEIGKMECLSTRFTARMRRLLDSDRPLLATVGRGGGEFMRAVRQRQDVLLTTVTEANRDRIPARAANWLENRFSRV